MFSDLLFFRSPIAPAPTASKHPEGLDFPSPDMGTEGRLSQIRAKACLASYPAAEREGRRIRMLSFPWYRSSALPREVPKLFSKEFSIVVTPSLEVLKDV